MTLRDFQAECSLYEYSNECFDLCKECAELSLTEQYIRNQMVMTESIDDLGIDEKAVLTEGYFAESSTEDELNALMEEAETKKKNIFQRIVQAFKNLCNRFASWILKRTGELDEGLSISDLKINYAEVSKQLEAVKRDLAAKHIEIKAAKKSAGKRVAALTSEKRALEKENERLQGENKKLGDDLSASIDTYTSAEAKYMAELAEAKIWYVKYSKLKKYCDLNELLTIMGEFGNALANGSTNSNVFVSLRNRLNNAVQKTLETGIKIDFEKKSFNDAVAKIKDSSAKLDQVKETWSNGTDSNAYVECNKTYTLITTVIGDTMSIVDAAITSRNKSQAPFKAAATKAKNKAATNA